MLESAKRQQKCPLDRGALGPDEDVLSPKAIEMGIGRVIKMESEGGGDLRFSCIALAKAE
jgi:ubiquitin carboxyl-terminal hydrolase L3